MILGLSGLEWNQAMGITYSSGWMGLRWLAASLHGRRGNLTFLDERTMGTCTPQDLEKECGTTMRFGILEVLFARRRSKVLG